MKLPLFSFKREPSARVARGVAELMSAFRGGVYEEARTRARQAQLGQVIDGNRPRGHWDKVRREIARRTGREPPLDTATRYLEP